METKMNNSDLKNNLPVQYLSSESDDDESSENEDFIETPKNVVANDKHDVEKKVNYQDGRVAM